MSYGEVGITELDPKSGEFRAKCPTFALTCDDCGREWDFTGTYEEVDAMRCEQCGSDRVSIRYMTFPTDGPGFQEGYSADKLRNPGCGSRN